MTILPRDDGVSVIILSPADVRAAVGCSQSTAEIWAPLLSGAAVLHSINTLERMAAWLATLAYESAGLERLEEDLDYSAFRLMQVWPVRFGPGGSADPAEYAHQPEKLANYIYADWTRAPSARLGNTQPGDGWRFRGRGPIQITGRQNYARCGLYIDVTLLRFPELLVEPPVGARSAAWFWQDKGLNDMVDAGVPFAQIVKRVSGGTYALDERTERFEIAQQVILGGNA